MLSNIRIVLVKTYHPGNIGSAARAMKTMGLNDLALVNPVDFPSDEALKMAVSADDLVKNASLHESLFEAVKDCSVIIASTARSRAYDLPELTPEESAVMLCSVSKKDKVALVFGPERMGLSNEDIQLAKYRVTIPTNPDYSSLNMAAAVQTLSYEVFKQHSQGFTKKAEENRDLPTVELMEQFYTHLEDSLDDSGFIIKNHPGEVMLKLRALFSRAQPDTTELNILRGILASFQRNHKENQVER
jgi:tRNA (cytidine32/uridine32-2'-O)-methyltransferase